MKIQDTTPPPTSKMFTITLTYEELLFLSNACRDAYEHQGNVAHHLRNDSYTVRLAQTRDLMRKSLE